MFYLAISFEPVSDYSVVSTKNLSKKITSSSWGLEPDDLGQKSPNLSHLWHHSRKNWNLKLFN